MDERDFARFAQFIHETCGIKLQRAKKTMLEARLQKRLRVLGLESYSAYASYLFSPRGLELELSYLIDCVTTNTTDFFRESRHFDYLLQSALPYWYAENGTARPFGIWSAGCSIGAEPYTLSMVCTEFSELRPGFRFDILATDISGQALSAAVRAIYTEDQARGVPDALKRKYLLRSKDRARRMVRIVPELRRQVTFKRLNFMEDFRLDRQMDVVFCRNVIIYFDRPTQEVLLGRLSDQLRVGGHMFIGHSESLTGMGLPLRQVEPTIYIKTGERRHSG
ncbi:CheR family methyltransferase [Desulfobaculum xiamenense]|nr:CheR family methyltransferase [Desulfobaculum xiamenense]